MSEAPFLSVSEVRQEVERLFRKPHRSRLVVLFGRGESEAFEHDDQPWRIVPTRCELELREALPKPGTGDGGGRVYLVDWTADALPLDLSCRLAGGRLYHVARDARLAALFGARQLEAGLAGSALSRLILSGAVAEPRKVQGLRLSKAHAWHALLEARLGLPQAALDNLGTLLAWAAGNNKGPAFVQQAEGDDLWRAASRELHGWLEGTLGSAGVVVWSAWERGLGGRLQEVLPLLAALRGLSDTFAAGQLAGQLSAWMPGLGPAVRAAEATLAADDVLAAALPTERRSLLLLMERSQALADGAGLHPLADASERLPGGHLARERALAEAVNRCIGERTWERAEAVVRALDHLSAHRLDEHLHPLPHRDARQNLARLALWLTSRPAPAPIGTRWQPAVDLARQYAEDGGYVEWARQQLRSLRGADERLLDAARTMESAVAGVLRDDHRAFAEAYVAWLEAGKPSAQALPIEDVAKQVIKPFLAGGARRRLLVVLMDGMSHAAAAQVLTWLADARRWGPIAWRRPGWPGVLPLPPVLAVAPTLTELSRGAFFAGAVDPRFYDEGSKKDDLRWRSNRALTALLGDTPHPLFLRRDILAGHDLAPDVRAAIDDPDARAVAVVVNAIDEDLSGSLQVARDYSRVPIQALETLLSAAEGAERVVLLVADHGHVLGDGTRPLFGRMADNRPGGARWRALAEGEAPADDEVVLPGTSWVPRGWHRVATLWDPSVVNRSAKYGEHGGLSLGEVVAPAVLIAPEWLERAFPDDPELAVRSLPLPEWWALRVRRPAPAAAPEPPPRERAQATLFRAPVAPAPAPSAPTTPALVEALRRSSVFQSQVQSHPQGEVARVLEWLGALVEAGGSLPSGDFAAACGVRAHQVGGVVARMGMLNADGFAMVEHDHVGRRVLLHRSRLEQHYGVRE